MSGLEDKPFDEFDWIEQDLMPLAEGAPEALGLKDDAAVIPGRPGFDLVISKDAIVAGVHFLPNDPPDLVARKLLRVNLSDLAAKGAEPYGYFLAVAWPTGTSRETRRRFAEGLKLDQDAFGIRLMGGDTVSTPGPLTASATVLGWVPAGLMIPRDAARAGDVVLVSGTIGDGGLGLRAAQGGLTELPAADLDWLADRYRLARPRLGLGEALRAFAHAAADVSDGLIADAGRIAAASGVAIEIDLARLPLSAPTSRWLDGQADYGVGLRDLATAGDDYEVVCTVSPTNVEQFTTAAEAVGVQFTQFGMVRPGGGVTVSHNGVSVSVGRPGYRHG
jgi:thiamine-monophosphate kinase